jgi:hypothetical protein
MPRANADCGLRIVCGLRRIQEHFPVNLS